MRTILVCLILLFLIPVIEVTDGVIETGEITTEVVEVITPTDPESYFHLTDEERYIVECVVMGEAQGEPYEGQVLVAQCILNACLRDGIQPSQVRKNYKYAGWKENPSDSVKKAVSAVFDDGFKVTAEEVLYFYAPKYCTSSWHESQTFVTEVGNHRFFKLNS